MPTKQRKQDWNDPLRWIDQIHFPMKYSADLRFTEQSIIFLQGHWKSSVAELLNSDLLPVIIILLALSQRSPDTKPFVRISAFINFVFMYSINTSSLSMISFIAAIETACVRFRYLMLGDNPFLRILIIAVLSS